MKTKGGKRFRNTPNPAYMGPATGQDTGSGTLPWTDSSFVPGSAPGVEPNPNPNPNPKLTTKFPTMAEGEVGNPLHHGLGKRKSRRNRKNKKSKNKKSRKSKTRKNGRKSNRRR